MTFLVLNRRPLVDRIPQWLADIDDDLVLLTARASAPAEVLAQHGQRYREVVVVDDYDGPAVEKLTLELAGRHQFTRVLSNTELDVLRAARIREKLDLPGQDITSATAYRDKFEMKSIIATTGLLVPFMRRIRSAAELRKFARDAGFPFVTKPTHGGGSVGVRVMLDPSAVERFIAETGGAEWTGLMAESWVNGDLYHVNGLMAGGQIVQSWPFGYRYPNLATVTDSRPVIGWMLLPGDRIGKRLNDFTAAVIRALPAPEEVTAFHAEMFLDQDDRIVMCEIACRPGGVGIVPAYERGLGVNLYAASLRGQAGYAPAAAHLVDEPAELAGFLWFPPRIGRLVTLPAGCPHPGVYRYSTTAAVGTEHHGARAMSDNIAQALVAGPGWRDLHPWMAELEAWWDAECCWAPIG